MACFIKYFTFSYIQYLFADTCCQKVLLINIKFLQKLIKQINQKMRQQSQSQHQSHSGYTIQSCQSRKQRIDKKRAIRKNKIGFVLQDSLQTKQDKRFLTKQQKIQIQKAKNRQAAQRSRDQHKKYVQTLEQQNRQLKELLAKPRYCPKCARQVLSESEDSTDPSFVNYQAESPLQTFVENQNNQECEQFKSHFIRMNDYQDSSPLKMFLLISMIMLGVFIMSGSTEGSTSQGVTLKRDLMEIQNLNNGYIIQNIQKQLQDESIQNKKLKQLEEINKYELQNQILNSFNMEDSTTEQNLIQDKIMTQIIPLSYQLSPLSQQNCLKSIIQNNYTELTKLSYSHPAKVQKRPSTFLRSNYLNQMQLFSSTISQAKNNLLFCSLPKLYRKSEEVEGNIFSKFIDIVISGSQMMQIIGKSPNLWMNKIVNFNGIYKINAQVKQIVQIQDRNCIL